MNRVLRGLVVLGLLAVTQSASASTESDIHAILQQDEAPPGVVFEIVTSDNEGLNWALPRTKTYIDKLRQQFPDLPIAIVTHGKEQFALQNQQQATNPELHSQVQSLLGEQVPVHVCGTFAGWRGLSEEDFPAHVNVAAAGPAQINDYVDLGYIKVIIRHRND